MPRPADDVRVEIIASGGATAGVLDNFTSLKITNDLTQPSQAAFELGEDGSFNSLVKDLRLGIRFKVFVNQRQRLTGRIENNDLPLDASAGSVIRFAVRTKLADATYSSANPRISVKDTSIKTFILELYKTLGYTEADFQFSAAAARNLLTGKSSAAGAGDTAFLERIKIKEAKVRPPETIYAAADRHLRRHGLMHWDSPDGKIVVGAPDDTQDPIYNFNAYTDPAEAQLNNVESITKVRDVSGMATVVGVFGQSSVRGLGGKRSRVKVHGLAANEEMGRMGFDRSLYLPAQGLTTQDKADHAAARELSARSKGFDTYVVETDGLSYWDGNSLTNYAPDSVAKINNGNFGGNQGAYLVHRTSLDRDADSGDKTSLNMLARGLWVL